jgi:hypothetical protein
MISHLGLSQNPSRVIWKLGVLQNAELTCKSGKPSRGPGRCDAAISSSWRSLRLRGPRLDEAVAGMQRGTDRTFRRGCLTRRTGKKAQELSRLRLRYSGDFLASVFTVHWCKRKGRRLSRRHPERHRDQNLATGLAARGPAFSPLCGRRRIRSRTERSSAALKIASQVCAYRALLA